MREVKLKPVEATPETFREFGQVVEASPDGDLFGPKDAQLDLSRGIPRFIFFFSLCLSRPEHSERPRFGSVESWNPVPSRWGLLRLMIGRNFAYTHMQINGKSHFLFAYADSKLGTRRYVIRV